MNHKLIALDDHAAAYAWAVRGNNDCPNPVVKTTTLRAYPGWVVREYRDGMFDGTNGIGLTLGCKTFAEVVACIKADR